MNFDAHRAQPFRHAPEVDVTPAGELDVTEAKHPVREHDGVPEAWLATRHSPQRLALAVAGKEKGGDRGNAAGDERGEDEPGHVV